jgi:RimJ/RimL family protein N-acetyltransferase
MKFEDMIAKTERLIISEFTFDDAAFIMELVNTPTWLENIGERNVKSEKDAKKYLENGPIKSYADHGFGLYRVGLIENNLPIGMCGLIKREMLKDVDIGFAFLPAYESKGYGFESAIAVLNFAKQIKLQRIVAITLPSNFKSVNLLKKLNMQFENPIHFQGEEKELMLYSIQL